MRQGAALELEQRFAVVVVAAVLGNGVFGGGAGQRVLEFEGDEGQAVDRERGVQGVGGAGAVKDRAISGNSAVAGS
jgi:hypothetical protein